MTLKTSKRRFSERTERLFMALYGAAVIGTGLLALLFPLAAGVSLGLVLGAALLTFGLVTMLGGVATGKTNWVDVLRGALAVLVAAAAFMTPLAATATLVWLTGAWLLVSGCWMLVVAFNRPAKRTWLLALAMLDICLGLLLLLLDPLVAVGYAAILLAVSLVMRGTYILVLALSGAPRP
ncbi:DUF308 domain-containing protein [Sphingobium sp.]|uniref:DUF308 domain-containing protein n=1 Tax=Sphingobium sp. TaxID=1912891 RepID=UPI000DAFA8C6|nr:DUF308 domain-containing protein [Sphingobium sp.]PZU69322.1 MAG: hypothetical protein DI540_05090 [Sphingobium sp.]